MTTSNLPIQCPSTKCNGTDKVPNSGISNFCPDQGRTRSAVRCTPVRRSRKPAENAEQGKKGYLWIDTIKPVTLCQQFSRCITHVSVIQIFD